MNAACCVSDASSNERVLSLVRPKRWVSLDFIRQAGAQGIFTALHEVPYGHIWPRALIEQRKSELVDYGFSWDVVESVPVHEDIKSRSGDYRTYIRNYCTTLKNLSRAGIQTVVYNFMPVLDWVRTDLNYTLEDGSQCLRFDPMSFAVFERYVLQREHCESDYSPDQLLAAERMWNAMSQAERVAFAKHGTKSGWQLP